MPRPRAASCRSLQRLPRSRRPGSHVDAAPPPVLATRRDAPVLARRLGPRAHRTPYDVSSAARREEGAPMIALLAAKAPKVTVNPDPSSLPGTPQLQQLIDGLAF